MTKTLFQPKEKVRKLDENRCTKSAIVIYHKWLTMGQSKLKMTYFLNEGGEEVNNEGLGGTETSITPSSICVIFFIEGLNEGSS